MKLSIIIPVYNEEKTIAMVLKRLEACHLPGIIKEIIIVDDGSTDATQVNVKKVKLKIRNLKLIHKTQNQGKGASIRTGIEQASGDYIIIQDADLEYDPRFIPLLLEPILQYKAEVVYGTRLKRLPHLKQEEKTILFIVHYLGNRLLSLMTSVLYGQWVTDMETGYKIIPAAAFKTITIYAKRFDFEPEITAKLIKQGYKITEIPISTVPRNYKEGKKIRTVRDGIIAFWALIKYRFIE